MIVIVSETDEPIGVAGNAKSVTATESSAVTGSGSTPMSSTYI